MLFPDSLHSSECLLIYVLGELLMSSMRGAMALISLRNFFFGSSSCTVSDSGGIISVPGPVFFLSLSFACNTSSLLPAPMNCYSVWIS